MTETEEIHHVRERLVKWEDRRRNQLGVTNNVVLGLATGLLGFLTNYLKDHVGSDNSDYAVFCIVTSILLAVIGSITRLYDYKKTTDTIRLKIKQLKSGKNFKEEQDDLRTESHFLGECTWFLLWAQLILFGLGTFFTGLVLGYL